MESHDITRELDDNKSGAGQHMAAGTTLADRYLIQGVLGIGGMSAVYRARDMHFPNVMKFVAVKEMINRAMDPVVRSTIVRNFEREANILASLDHRGIPRIYDYFSINERSYLILEFINGRDLEAIINDNRDLISERQIIQWAIELCDVLSYLHNHKPEAIIYAQNRAAVINLLVLCDWIYPVLSSPGTEDRMGDTSFESRLLSAATGTEWAEEELNRIGERVWNLARTIMAREGRTRDQDALHEALFREVNGQVAPATLKLGPAGNPFIEFGVLGFLMIRSDGIAADGIG